MNLAALLQFPPQSLAVFFLVLVRATSIFLTAPVLGNTNVPARVKIGLASLIALIMTPMLLQTPPVGDLDNMWWLLPATLSEIMLGVLIGLLAQFFFVSVQFAGQIVGLQMGFGMASVFDPQFSGQVSVVGQFYMMVGILVFLLLDGHHWVLIALEKSYTAVPLASFRFDETALNLLLAASSDLFWVALMIMAPVLGVLVLGEAAMAIVARIMPQMNVFVAAFPVKIALGIVTMAVSFPLLIGYLGAETEKTFVGILQFITH